MIFMKRTLVVVTLALLLACPAVMADVSDPDSLVTVPEETIHVADGEVTLTVVFESQTGAYNGTVEVWAPSGATLSCQGDRLDPVWNGSVATVDLAAHGLRIPADGNLSLTARYPRDGNVVHQMLYAATVTVTVESDAWVRSSVPLSYADGGYTGTASFVQGEEVSISFAAPADADDDGTIFLYLGGGLAAGALAAGAAMFLLQRRRRDRYLEKEPVEALEMRKKLLTRLLKQLEIERDKGKIADAYYQSIKDSFKEQAVAVMREIDRRS